MGNIFGGVVVVRSRKERNGRRLVEVTRLKTACC